MGCDGQNLGNYMSGSWARQVEAHIGKWAGDEENVRNHNIDSQARQVYESLATLADHEQVWHAHDSILVSISACHMEDPGSLPDHGIKFIG